MFNSICIVIYETNYVSSREPPPLLTTNGNADTNNLTPEEGGLLCQLSVIAWLSLLVAYMKPIFLTVEQMSSLEETDSRHHILAV